MSKKLFILIFFLQLPANYSCSNIKTEQQAPAVSKGKDTTSIINVSEKEKSPIQEQKVVNKCNSISGSINDSVYLSFNCLRIGLPYDSVLVYFGNPENESDFILGGTDGEFKKNIDYTSQGITIGISTPDTNTTKPKVISFILNDSCALVTAGNVGIGTPVEDVKSALSGIISKETEKRIFVGDDYYGTVFFKGEGKVKKVYVGQLAE